MPEDDTKSDIVVVGSINRDYLIESTKRPAPGETVTGARYSTAGGGKGANQAVAAALLGAAVALIGRVGDDAAGRDLLESLTSANVNTAGVVVSPSVPTGAAFVTVTPDGENSIIVASGANWLLRSREVGAARSQLATARLLVVQLEVPEDAVETAIALVRRDAVVVLNAAPYRSLDRTVLERVDVLVLNALEARQLVGEDADPDDPAAFSRLGPRATVITLGSLGVRAFVGRNAIVVAAPWRQAVDTTGAGDAFVGALCAWLVSEEIGHFDDLTAPLMRALPAAVAAAAYSVGRRGAQSSYGTAKEVGAPWV